MATVYGNTTGYQTGEPIPDFLCCLTRMVSGQRKSVESSCSSVFVRFQIMLGGSISTKSMRFKLVVIQESRLFSVSHQQNFRMPISAIVSRSLINADSAMQGHAWRPEVRPTRERLKSCRLLDEHVGKINGAVSRCPVDFTNLRTAFP